MRGLLPDEVRALVWADPEQTPHARFHTRDEPALIAALESCVMFGRVARADFVTEDADVHEYGITAAGRDALRVHRLVEALTGGGV